jgi:hypothetical protein
VLFSLSLPSSTQFAPPAVQNTPHQTAGVRLVPLGIVVQERMFFQFPRTLVTKAVLV